MAEEEQIMDLLKAVHKVLQKTKQETDKGYGFNVFHLCGVDHYETMHSKIIAEFLDPQGSHGQGGRFLECFNSVLKNNFQFEGRFSEKSIVTTEVTEYVKGNSVGRLDILIEDNATNTICVIENKIFAGEQPDQLDRYVKWLEKERKGWKSILIFLTLNGREAWSIKDQNKYEKLAYVSQSKEQEGMIDWLCSCIKAIQGDDKPFIQTAMEQYEKHIVNLAIGEKAMREEITNSLKGKMQCAKLIIDNYASAKLEIEREFFHEVGKTFEGVDWVAKSWDGVAPYSREGERGWGWLLCEKNPKCRREFWLRVFIGKECQVGLFRPDFVVKKTMEGFDKWCKDNKDRLVKEGWYVNVYTDYPLYREVLDGGFHVIEWDEHFLDMIVTDGDYRQVVKGKIIENIEMLRKEVEVFIDGFKTA